MSEISTETPIVGSLRCPACDTGPAEPKPAKVIIVTEAPVGERGPVGRRYAASMFGYLHGGSLAVGHPHGSDEHAMTAVASYAPGAWLSVRDDGALVPDYTMRQLGIARLMLEVITGESCKDDTASTIRILAREALDQIAELDL